MSQEDQRRWKAAAHAVQSGVATEMEFRREHPKHLRTGINIAMTDLGSLARLLVEKGVITLDEYEKAIADGMEAEKARYEAHLSGLLGSKVTLG